MKRGRAVIVGGLLGLSLAAACGDDAGSPRVRVAPGTGQTEDGGGVTTSGDAGDAGTPVIDDATAIAWLETSCRGCHGSSERGLDPTWPMPSKLTREWLAVSETTSMVYELLEKKRRGVQDGTFPSPMPIGGADPTAVVRWLEATMPERVFEDARRPPVHTYTCQSPLSGRAFLERFMQAALVRAPTTVDLAAIPAPDAPLSREARAAIVARLRTDWKSDFLKRGMGTFARIVTQVGATPYPGWSRPAGTKEPFNTNVSNDATQELYQLYLAHYDEWDYRDYFTANVVMTSPNTADAYACVNTTGGWKECPLVAPRGGFFTTLSYLNLLQESYLTSSNSGRRFSGLHFTLVGEGTARTGLYRAPAKPPPDCIDPTDSRELAGVPPPVNGVGSDPASGGSRILLSDAVCQSCHLHKGVAAGMILFRPFASNGRVFVPDQFDRDDVRPDVAALAEVLTPGRFVHHTTPDGGAQPVDMAYMKSLILPASIRACISKDAAHPYESLTSVNDLAKYFLRDTPAAARGFARHANRAYRDLVDGDPLTTAIDKNPMPLKVPKLITTELATKSIAALDAKTAKLPDLFELYFSSDSFACAD